MKYKIRLVGATKEVEAEKCHVCTQGHLWLYNGDFTESGAVAVFNRSEWLASERKDVFAEKKVYPDDFLRVPDISIRELLVYHDAIRGLLNFLMAEWDKGNKEAIKTLEKWDKDRARAHENHNDPT